MGIPTVRDTENADPASADKSGDRERIYLRDKNLQSFYPLIRIFCFEFCDNVIEF